MPSYQFNIFKEVESLNLWFKDTVFSVLCSCYPVAALEPQSPSLEIALKASSAGCCRPYNGPEPRGCPGLLLAQPTHAQRLPLFSWATLFTHTHTHTHTHTLSFQGHTHTHTHTHSHTHSLSMAMLFLFLSQPFPTPEITSQTHLSTVCLPLHEDRGFYLLFPTIFAAPGQHLTHKRHQ